MPAPQKRGTHMAVLAGMVAWVSLTGWTPGAAAKAPEEPHKDSPVEGTAEAKQTLPRGAKELFYDPLDRSVVSTSGEPSAPPHPSSRKRVQSRTPSSGNAGPSESTATSTRISHPNPHPLGLSYWLELVGPDTNPGIQVTEKRVFWSGERIRLHFRSNTDGHLMLIELGTSGTSRVLFPNPALGLIDSSIAAGEDRILPGPSYWFRFDHQPGTERLLVLFAATQEELDRFPMRRNMDAGATRALLDTAAPLQGSKDLVIETETRVASEIGTYGVNVAGQPVVLEIVLQHR